MFILLGAGALARDIVETVSGSGRSDLPAGFLVHSDYATEKTVWGLPVFTEYDDLPTREFVVGVGDRELRLQMISYAGEIGLIAAEPLVSAATYVSPRAEIHGGVGLGFNSIVECNVIIGEHSLLMHNALVSHDCRVGENCVVAPGAVVEGHATVGKHSFIGANAAIAPGVTIGDNCHVSPGSSVLRDVPDGSTVIGNPGRIIKSVEPKVSA